MQAKRTRQSMDLRNQDQDQNRAKCARSAWSEYAENPANEGQAAVRYGEPIHKFVFAGLGSVMMHV